MNILYFDAHSILTYDELRLFHSLGHDVFNVGGYINPAEPHEAIRPGLPDLSFHADLKAVVDALGVPDNLMAAKCDTPDELLDWADVLICAAFEHTWLVPQWPRLREWMQSGKRVIWRTIGQSVENNERMMKPLFDQGLEIVRYSPKERNIPGYAGESALIRFAKDPQDWHGWTGEKPSVINVTQGLRQREPFTNWRFWELVTYGLDRLPTGPGSEVIGGTGSLDYDAMRQALRDARCYLYTGTQPASYTLGFIEAMMTGVPIVSIGPDWCRIFDYGPDLFEAHELSPYWSNDEDMARAHVQAILRDPKLAEGISEWQRVQAFKTFGVETIAPQWDAYLSVGAKKEAVAA